MAGQASAPPSGAVNLCQTYPWACSRNAYDDVVGRQVLQIITDINRRINREIHYISDETQFKIPEYWALPTSRGGEKHDMALWKNFVAIHDAVLACMTDEPDAAERLDLVLEAYRASGCWLWVTLYLSEQAKALLRAGEFEAAQISVERALREQEKTGERWAEAELRRIEGEILAARGDVDGAQSAFESAISIARAQQSHALAERAAKSAQAHR